VTTAAGIVVAVEAVVIYNFFNSQLAKVGTEIKLDTEEFLEALDESGAHSAGQKKTAQAQAKPEKSDKSEAESKEA
jgi:hypothetical protein